MAARFKASLLLGERFGEKSSYLHTNEKYSGSLLNATPFRANICAPLI
ncbi:hypothetical protein GXM_05295 [Nostoc sphaeroides CCNUC1]|uniref:Uncharacterized protein n=1 Tax=Nostoc sphaeroides CCNUC1 TaxID=2653204 RepID=A0A5P8W4Y9_9NOSO|nr:hypothetical protein GXM_05295 [Nostoc sphaeroides CCNUC1]